MADKKETSTKPTTVKNTVPAKATSATAKPAAKPAATTAKPATATAKPVAKPAAAAKPTVTAKPAVKATPASTAKPNTAAKPATTATKPAEKSTTTAEAKPAAKTTTTTEKPAAKSTNAKVTEKSDGKNKAVADSTSNPVKEKRVKESAPKSNSKAAVLVHKIGVRNLAIIGATILCIICLILGLALGTRPQKPAEYNTPFYNLKTGTTLVGHKTEEIGTVERNIPTETKNEGYVSNDKYPVYGITANLTAAEKTAVIRESSYLTATGTSNAGGGQYTFMDEDGYLYSGTNTEEGRIPTLNSANEHRQLYKHTASVGLYRGNVSDDEPAVIKNVQIRARGYTRGYSVTGLYAPAGEVVKVQISDEDMTATGGIIIHIGQALYNGKANNIWSARAINRMPVILNTMGVNRNTATFDEETGLWTAYVGSFLGGPIYVRNTGANISVTISGAVNYSHFILGYTTEEEFNRNAQSTAPYFDLEVWNYGVLHSGPKVRAQAFSYDEIYDAAVLWEKVSLVSTQRSSQGIVFLYDPFVAAGAAVAFPGQGSVNCPDSWMTSSLNYEAFVKQGAWGNMHEYNHNFQGYGCGSGADGETTNNALNLVSYSLFTEISRARTADNYGGGGLSGWNCYTSGSWTLYRVKTNQLNSTDGLAVYATLLHNFGQDAFMKSSRGTGLNYFKNWGNTVHYDMSYYAELTKSFYYSGTDSEFLTNFKTPLHEEQRNYPMFVPVSCIYQTGRSYNYDGEKRYIETMQPFVVNEGETFTVDLSKYAADSLGRHLGGSIILPDGFTCYVKSIDRSGLIGNGTFERDGDSSYMFKYTPATNTDSLRSGKIIVTLEILKDDREFSVEDVDLVLEFQQSYESTKFNVQRTTYTYTESTKYTDAQTAYENGYSGYESVKVGANSNPTQNSNTDAWFYADTEDNRRRYPTAPDDFFASEDGTVVTEIKGKLGFSTAGKYRIYLRGRLNCALYYSTDGGSTYTLGATIKDTSIPANSANFRVNDPNTYFDVEIKDRDIADGSGIGWVYYKSVLIVQAVGSTASYMGLGFAQWQAPQYTIVTRYYNANGDEVDAESEDIAREETKYYNASGVEVTQEEASNSALIEPRSASYATAYRQSYMVVQNVFTSDYFYKRNYNYSYTGDPTVVTEDITQTYMDGNYVPWQDTEAFAISNLFDGDPATYIHSGNGNDYAVNANNPALFTVALRDDITANFIRLYPSTANANHISAFPRDFSLQGSKDGKTYFDMGSYTGKTAPSVYMDLPLAGTFTFKYYKLTVTATNSNTQRLALADIQFVEQIQLTGSGNFISPDSDIFIRSGAAWANVQDFSSFGHSVLGQAGSNVSFTFTGTRVAILTPNAYKNNANIVVLIDGKVANSIQIKEQPGTSVASICFLSEALKQGTHTVGIVCNGEFRLDSVATW